MASHMHCPFSPLRSYPTSLSDTSREKGKKAGTELVSVNFDIRLSHVALLHTAHPAGGGVRHSVANILFVAVQENQLLHVAFSGSFCFCRGDHVHGSSGDRYLHIRLLPVLYSSPGVRVRSLKALPRIWISVMLHRQSGIGLFHV